jgi:two-component system, response regulator, stage 0 sporulation protein F
MSSIKRPVILYVDDNSINLQLFEAIMGEKYQVLLAEDGWKGLSALETQSNIQVVISDMKMPYMDGLEFISKAKAKYPTLSYFILTAYDVSSDIQKAFDQGLILQCFRKPFDVKNMEDEINKVL